MADSSKQQDDGENDQVEVEAMSSMSPSVARMHQVLDPMPKLRAKVVHGFGRGSKVLGFPTANMEVLWDKASSPDDLAAHERDVFDFANSCKAGIYSAWAQVVDGKDRGVYKVAMSIGWNPTFTDVKRKTLEPWILHDYESDFYDSELRLIVCSYVRPELKFDKFDDLIKAIRDDGTFCSEELDKPPCSAVREDPFFVPVE